MIMEPLTHFDIAETELFLRLLDPVANVHIFFFNPERGGCTRHCQELTTPLDPDSFKAMNNDGLAILVTVNATNFRARTAKNITSIRAVWQDDDDCWQGEFPLEPSCVVETSPGKHHRYWLVDGGWSADAQGRLDFRSVMAGMVENFGCDPQASDISRLLRVPGFWHQKGRPHLVRIVGGNSERYTRDEIVTAFAVPLPEPATLMPINDEDWKAEERRVLGALHAIPANCPRHEWLAVGMALHVATAGNGFEIWEAWSKQVWYPDQNEALRKAWASFKHKDHRITLGTLFHIALQYGWRDRVIMPEFATIPQEVVKI